MGKKILIGCIWVCSLSLSWSLGLTMGAGGPVPVAGYTGMISMLGIVLFWALFLILYAQRVETLQY